MQRLRSNTALFDPGWLFLLSGLALMGATVVISAQNDTQDARFLRDRALAAEAHRHERMGRYEEFLGAIDARQPALIESLAAAQLNQIPAARAAIPGTVRDNMVDASVFPALEPPALRLPARRPVESTLGRLVGGESTRIWLLAGSVFLILIGLLPKSKGWADPARRAGGVLGEPKLGVEPAPISAIAEIEGFVRPQQPTPAHTG